MIIRPSIQRRLGLAVLSAGAALTFLPELAQAQVGVSISLGGGPVYAAPPPEYVAPAYVAPPVYGPEYVPDYYDYHHRPRPRPRRVVHAAPHGGPHGHR